MKVSPVLLTDSIEKSLLFWEERMSWKKTVEVPGEDGLAFAILENEGAELMLQTFTSAASDAPMLVGLQQQHRASLFIEVTDWTDTLRRLEGYRIAMPERKSSYGMREIGVFDPGGHVVIFASPEA